jgi:hypothetical protein
MQSRWIQPVLALLAVVLLGVLAWMLLTGDDDDVSLTPGQPEVVSVSQLEGFAEDADHQIYWAGEKPDTEIELTETDDGRIYVRYLPSEGGDATAFLTVASYPVDDGAAALERSARNTDNKEIARSDDGAVVLIDTESPNNAHLAYPGDDLQIEIFSPVTGEALRLASRDRVEPVP